MSILKIFNNKLNSKLRLCCFDRIFIALFICMYGLISADCQKFKNCQLSSYKTRTFVISLVIICIRVKKQFKLVFCVCCYYCYIMIGTITNSFISFTEILENEKLATCSNQCKYIYN